MRRGGTVLIIDYYFPPVAVVGVHRTLGHVTHLGEFGWSPTVLTARPGDHGYYDPLLSRRVPETVCVHRTRALDLVGFAKRALTPGRPGRGGSPGDGLGTAHPWRGPRWMRSVGQSLLFPDRYVGWLPSALARAVSICRRQTIDIVYSTSGAVTSHLIAYALKRLLGKPWVADFQDPWADGYFHSAGLRRAGAERLEHLIVKTADRVTFATEPVRDAYRRKYAVRPEDKCVAIPSGFDPDAFRDVAHVRQPKFTITHFGAFYCGRSPGPFLEALAGCVGECPGLRGDAQVRFFGSFDAEMLGATQRALDRLRLREMVRLEGVVPYTAGVQHLVNADVLLLVAFPGDDGQNLIPAKLFDYLAAGRPILALAPHGPAARIVRAAHAGLVVEPADAPAIRTAILDLYRRWKDGHPSFQVDHRVVEQFTWRALARDFAAVLDDMVAACACAPHGVSAGPSPR